LHLFVGLTRGNANEAFVTSKVTSLCSKNHDLQSESLKVLRARNIKEDTGTISRARDNFSLLSRAQILLAKEISKILRVRLREQKRLSSPQTINEDKLGDASFLVKNKMLHLLDTNNSSREHKLAIEQSKDVID
jgi:hypothetical protein